MRYINKQSDSIIKLILKCGELLFTEQLETLLLAHSCLEEFDIKTLERYNLLVKAMKDGDILASDFEDVGWFKECFLCVINQEKALQEGTLP